MIEINQEEIDKFGAEIIGVIDTKGMTHVEIFGMLDNIHLAYLFAALEKYMREKYGLVEVEK